ncbi:hypothetical protein [Streptomyces sp. NRRL S-37]|uniref:hypothetical protein n=1 Tax=Streptomyces sp. NRRL S-37 TaxID=1463903 RepID=UPI00131E4A65|nr:hypothetical protein [Streptomyces sp. NRRL S-37]
MGELGRVGDDVDLVAVRGEVHDHDGVRGGVTREQHPAHQQIPDAVGPMRARDLCKRLDLAVAPKNIDSTRHKLERLVGLGVLAGTEPGLFAQRRP